LVSQNVLHGSSLSRNLPPKVNGTPKLKLNGKFKGSPASFELDESILSKHSMLIGGTGCGKTTLFYHFISQIKQRMTKDDVMIVFDSKGDFYNKQVKLELIDFIRPEQKFDSLTDLKTAINLDIEKATEIL